MSRLARLGEPGAVAASSARPAPPAAQPLSRPLDGAVCAPCWAAWPPSPRRVCTGVRRPAAVVARLVPSMRAAARGAAADAPVLARQAAIGPHEGALRSVVHALKYDRAPLDGGAAGGADARRRCRRRCVMRTRGGAGAAASRAARGPAASIRRRCSPGTWARRRIRSWHGPAATPPQVSLPAAQRHRNVRDAFAARPPRRRPHRAAPRRSPVADLVVVLVDDVCTTGATLEACGRALRAAGVGEVRALTASRVVTGPRWMTSVAPPRPRAAARRSAANPAPRPGADSSPAPGTAAAGRARTCRAPPACAAATPQAGCRGRACSVGLRQVALHIAQPRRVEPLRLAVGDARSEVAIADDDGAGRDPLQHRGRNS